jgi:uncharacterized membrane protein YqaE (UPF0057 family)
MTIQIILKYGNKSYIKDIDNKDIDNKNIHTYKNSLTIKDLFLDIIKKESGTYKYKSFENNNYIDNYIDNYIFIKDGKILSPDINIYSITSGKKIYNIQCYNKQYGGDSIGDAILDGILSIFDILLFPLKALIRPVINLFIMLCKAVLWLIKLVIWLFRFIIWIFTDLLNPMNFCKEFLNGLLTVLIGLISSIFNIFITIISMSINTVGGWMQGFWGWDISNLTETDRQSNYFKNINKRKGEKCYLTNGNTVPFSIILGTILCPPIGVFMDLGLTGWINILICILLTLMYYVPGLIYALLVIYS